MRNYKRYTILDIAKEVGVSSTTVSRYSSGQFQYMSKETKEKIRTAVEKYDYHPSLQARGLKSNRSYLIGVIMPQVHLPLSSHSIRGICMACTQATFSPIIVSIEDRIEKELDMIQDMINRRVDGILSFTGSNGQYYSKADENGTPVVLVDRCSASCTLDCVYIDHYKIVQESLLNLHVAGFTKIAMYTARSSISPYSSTNIRKQAYYNFFQHDIPIEYVIDETNLDDIKSNVMNFMERFPKERKAIFVSSMGSLSMVDLSCKLLGIKYPDELAIYGYAIEGDLGPLISKLTVISQPIYKMCSIAVAILGKRIEGLPVDSAVDSSNHVHIAIPAPLIIRESTLRK